ncbi:hypothetical protein PAPYR_7782 [Paratrimastix pyriformis]|uniref:Uncharacterized protein n=1 Tax=Paratrimastix pyriformis TaxID=342808 RepID=A0ABQ8UJ69_9EUKA|nr:hypothetical protein PAPYR_7782 [Paratrimastix pyriformis]
MEPVGRGKLSALSKTWELRAEIYRWPFSSDFAKPFLERLPSRKKKPGALNPDALPVDLRRHHKTSPGPLVVESLQAAIISR